MDRNALIYSKNRRPLVRYWLIILIALALLPACKGGSNVGQSATADIPPGGGAVTLEGIATVTFPAGAFTDAQQVLVETTADADIAGQFDQTADMYLPGPRSDYEVRINTGAARPQSDIVDVQLVIPRGLTVPAGSSVAVFVQRLEGTEDEQQDVFAAVSSSYDAASNMLSFQVAGLDFSNERTADKSYELVVLLSVVPGTAASGNRLTVSFETICGNGLKKPLSSLKVKSPFDYYRDNSMVGLGPGHFGTDFVAADGEPVLAAGDGKVIAARESTYDPPAGATKEQIMEGRKHDNFGAGGIITVQIPGVGQVKYFHLQKGSIAVKPGDTVTAGQPLAAADNTGASTGTHLHFEFVPLNSIGRADAEPCIMSNTLEGKFTVTHRETRDGAVTSSETVSGTLRWELGYVFPDIPATPVTPAMPAVRIYEAPTGTLEVTNYQYDDVVCEVTNNPITDMLTSHSALYIYPKIKKYKIAVDLGPEAQAICTNQKTGRTETTRIYPMIRWAYDIGFMCTGSKTPDFPGDFIEYSYTDEHVIEGTYELKDCPAGDGVTVDDATAGWKFTTAP